MVEDWLKPDLLKEDINEDLERLEEPILIREVKQLIPNFPDAVDITYFDMSEGEGGLLVGTLLTEEEQDNYEKRHMWTMEIALAIQASRSAGGDA